MTIPDSSTATVPVDFTAADLKLTNPDKCRQGLQELERRKQMARDIVVPASKLSMDVAGRLAIDHAPGEATPWATAYNTRPHAHRQIAEKMNIPHKYYQRMLADAPGLLSQNVTHWLHDDDEGRKFLIRIMPDIENVDHIRAVLSDRFLLLSDHDVFMHGAKAALAHGAKITDLLINEEQTRMSMMLPQFGFRVSGQYGAAGGTRFVTGVRNDVTGKWDAPGGEGTLCYPACSITNSEVGLGAFEVKLMLKVNECDNSIVLKIGESFRRVHLGPRLGEGSVFKTDTQEAKEKAIWMEARDLIDAAFNPETIAEVIQNCNRTQSQVLDDPVQAVNAVVESYNLGDDEKQAIINELIAPSLGDNVGATVWGLINAVTARAHAKGSVAETIRYEEIGGDLMDADQVLVKVRAVAPQPVR